MKIHPTALVDPGAQIGADVEIGPFSVVGPGAVVGDNTIVQSHVVIEGNVAIGTGNFIGQGAIIGAPPQDGGGSTFHQHMHVGRLVMVQGSSAFGKDLPPYVIAAERNSVFGVNVVGLRRAGVSAKDRNEIKAAFKLLYMSGLNIGQAIEKAATMKFGAPAHEFIDFVANAKKRGVCPFKRGTDEEMSI